MKKRITRQVYLQAKALLDQGKTQAKVSKKLKIGTGTVSKISRSKSYPVYCGKKVSRYGWIAVSGRPQEFAIPRVGKPVDMTDLDRNFALDKKIKKLQIEVKKNPAFAKFVENEVALVMNEKLTKATAEKQGTIDTQAKRISELTIQADKDLQELVSLRAFGVYVDSFLSKWVDITSNAFKVLRILAFLIGFIWISWLLVTHFR